MVYPASPAGLVLRSRHLVRKSSTEEMRVSNGFTGRAQNSSPPSAPQRERASGKVLAFLGIYLVRLPTTGLPGTWPDVGTFGLPERNQTDTVVSKQV
jgi:hypothetical protein